MKVGTRACVFLRHHRGVEEARRLIDRLERIDELERRLLAEIRALMPEAVAWARREGDERASAAVAQLVERIRAA